MIKFTQKVLDEVAMKWNEWDWEETKKTIPSNEAKDFETVAETSRQEAVRIVEEMERLVNENLLEKHKFPKALEIQRYCLGQLNVLKKVKERLGGDE